jgi:sec-independent protein translocase protein TatA
MSFMFGMGTTEMLVILGIVVIMFGASRLPQLGEGMGKALRGFKKAVSEIDAPDPPKPPVADKKPDPQDG